MFKSKAAIVGTGFIGPVHVEGLRRAGVNVIGILGSAPEKSRNAARQLGVDRGYDSFDDLVADPDVDVIHITSPNRFHFPQSKQALQAGKHVVCEKPLAMNRQETSELVRVAAASGKLAALCYNLRYYALCIEAAQRVRRGSVGDIFHVTGSYVQDWLFHRTDFNWRVIADEGGPLRALADIGTHWLDMVQFITGNQVTAVNAQLHRVYPTRQTLAGSSQTFSSERPRPEDLHDVAIDTEDFGSVMLRFSDGSRGQFHVSQVTAGRKNCCQFEIAGAKCTLGWHSQTPDEMFIGYRDQPNEQLNRDPALMSAAAAAATSFPGGHIEGYPDTFKQLFRAIYAQLEDGSYLAQPTFPTFPDGHHEVVLCDAMLASHQQQSWIEVESMK